MSSITRLAMRQGAVVMLAALLLFGAGIYAATQLQQDLLPNISPPTAAVTTVYPGASPEIVDENVTVLVTSAVQAVNGVSSVRSTSNQGVSVVVVEFANGTNLTTAEQDLNAAVGRIRGQLPQQATAPSVKTFSTSSTPILTYSVTADESLGDLAGQLRTQALPVVQGLAGVTSIVITGAPTDEVEVILDPVKLRQHNLSVAQVGSALQQASTVESIGQVQQD